jgi:hypothetical protein
MATYRKVKDSQDIIHLSDAEDNNYYIILFDPANTDYQTYLKWVAEGNTPEPSDE